MDHSLIDSIVSMASYSPSWKNTQITRYTAIEDSSLLNEIADKYTPDYNSKIIRQAPMLMAVTFIKGRSGFERDGSYSTKKGGSWQMFDVGAACQTFCLAAKEKGLGTVIMGIFDEDGISELLHIPEEQGTGCIDRHRMAGYRSRRSEEENDRRAASIQIRLSDSCISRRRLFMRHLMSPLDFSVEELDNLLDLAQDIEANPAKYAHACEGKKLATLFYEPSTRTRLSHEAAMLNLGGSVMGFASSDSSSASKGESVADTIRVISCYADICAMRHPKEGAPMVACQHSTIPVINAGDGGHQHPTQTLTDLLTIRNLKGRLNNMTIGLCGDLKFGRTVHSLINALVRYEGIRFILISPEELRLPDYIRHEVLDRNNIPYEEVVRLEDALPSLDILYMTRVQKERFFNEEDYVRMKDFYILDKEKMKLAPEDMYVLHPLPRVNEIAVEVDDDPRAAYFRQVQYGVYVRMALILTLLGYSCRLIIRYEKTVNSI